MRINNHRKNKSSISLFFVESCVEKFQSRKRQWWQMKVDSEEGECCCLLWDLLELVELDKKIETKQGLHVLVWWLYDQKFFDPNKTLYLDPDLLQKYRAIANIWQLNELIGSQCYTLLYAYLLALSKLLSKNNEPLTRITESSYLSESNQSFKKVLLHNAERLRTIIENYLIHKNTLEKTYA